MKHNVYTVYTNCYKFDPQSKQGHHKLRHVTRRKLQILYIPGMCVYISYIAQSAYKYHDKFEPLSGGKTQDLRWET